MMYQNIVLAGNPNSGKTTLYNALTGSEQRVGNWPGVTVEKKQGTTHIGSASYQVIDLPGAYSLDDSQADGLDERIAAKYINDMDANSLIVNVVDATHLERHLYLTVQLLEYGLPMMVVLTMTDRLPHSAIDTHKLAMLLGVPVVSVAAHQEGGLDDFKRSLSQFKFTADNHLQLEYPAEVTDELESIKSELTNESAAKQQVLALRQWQAQTTDADILIADTRFGMVHSISRQVKSNQPSKQKHISQLIDKIVLNRFLGLPIFLMAMYAMFVFAINIGGVFQACFDQLSELLFVDSVAHLFNMAGMPAAFTAVLAYGLGKGINTVVTFIPVISAMFLFLSFLEGTGYMARAAFVIDRLMRMIGLPGKAFVPLIVGFGCNVPAIMATRTLESEKDRILAIMMSPFMSCSARLAIFTVFVGVFFPVGGHNIVFALYLIGIAVAVVTGYFLRSTLLNKRLTPLLMELPDYHIPNFKALMRQVWSRLKHFIQRAGRVIIPVCTILGAINMLSYGATGLELGGDGKRLLSYIGELLTPLLAPMGISSDNWPATVGLLMGTMAKEVVIATLNTLYSSLAGLQSAANESFQFWGAVQAALMTIPENITDLATAVVNPVAASLPDQQMDNQVLGVLAKHFKDGTAAFAYLLFVLLYVPCISTMAAIKKELNQFWMLFSIVWSTSIAYMTATLFYQLATMKQHYLASSLYFIAFLMLLVLANKVIKQALPSLKHRAYG